jgi:hypothetical protein
MDGDAKFSSEVAQFAFGGGRGRAEDGDGTFVAAVGDGDGLALFDEGESLGQAGFKFANGEGGSHAGKVIPTGQVVKLGGVGQSRLKGAEGLPDRV